MSPAASPSRAILIAYALPAFAPAVLALPLVVYLPSFYAVEIGLGFVTVGSVLFAARAIAVIFDPMVGWTSDRTPTRWGRRRPWPVVAGIVLAGGAWWIAHPPDGARAFDLAVVALAVYLGGSLLAVPHQAWGAELARGPHERSRLMGARAFATLAGLATAAGLPLAQQLLGEALPAGEAGTALAEAILIVVLTLPACVIAALWVVPEEGGPIASSVSPAMSGAMAAGLRRLLAAYFCAMLANATPAALLLLFVTYVVVLPEFLGLVLVAYFVGALAGVPLWLAYARRYGKPRAWCLALLFGCVAFAVVPLVGRGELVAVLAVSAAAGVAFGADLTLPPGLIGDLAEPSPGGEPRAGRLFGLLGAAGQLAVVLVLALAVPLLQLVGFGSPDISPATGVVLLIALFVGPAVALKLAALALMWNFPGAEPGLRRAA